VDFQVATFKFWTPFRSATRPTNAARAKRPTEQEVEQGNESQFEELATEKKQV